MHKLDRGRTKPGNAGFAAADGLMALTLVSVLVVLVMNAISAGINASRRGAERRAAAAEIEHRILTEWSSMRQPGERAGRSPTGEGWSVTAHVQATGGGGPALCAVTSTLHLKQPVRTYRLQTLQFCRDDAGQ